MTNQKPTTLPLLRDPLRPAEFGILDAFSDEDDRCAHLSNPSRHGLAENMHTCPASPTSSN